MDYDRSIDDFDTQLKAGSPDTVAKALADFNLVQVPREFRLPLAVIARRAGVWQIGLRLLTKIVRNSNRRLNDSTVSEQIEFSALLAQNGSFQEALEILDGVDEQAHPDSLLIRGFAYVRQWSYERALPSFEKYLKTHPDPYLEIIARVNMAAALVATAQVERGLELINENLKLAEKGQSARLIGNSLELRAQVFLSQKKFAECRKDLEKAQEILSAASLEFLFVQKWQAILQAVESGAPEALVKVKLQAEQIQNWDTVREADLYLMKIAFDQVRFDHLYFGTPLQGYRNRITREISHLPSPSYLLGGIQDRTLHLATGNFGEHKDFSPGKKIHQLLEILCRDFYAPVSVGQIFSQLHEGEHFDIFTSPARIHNIVRRLREWIESAKIPAVVDFSEGGYRLQISGSFAIKIDAGREKVDLHHIFLERLSQIIKAGELFSVQTVCQKMDMPKTTILRLMKPFVQSGKIVTLGSGRATKYQIKNPQ